MYSLALACRVCTSRTLAAPARPQRERIRMPACIALAWQAEPLLPAGAAPTNAHPPVAPTTHVPARPTR